MHLPTTQKKRTTVTQIQPCCALIGWRSAAEGWNFPLSHHQLNNLPFYVTDEGFSIWRKIISTPTFPNLLRVVRMSQNQTRKSLPKFQSDAWDLRRGTSPFANQSDVEQHTSSCLWQSAGNQTRSGWRICFSCWFPELSELYKTLPQQRYTNTAELEQQEHLRQL